MDDPQLPPALHREALAGLARLNTLSRSNALVWSAIDRHVARRSSHPLTVLDLACGDGALLRALHRRAGGRLRGIGLDASAEALRLARRASPEVLQFRQVDLLAPQPWPLRGRADVVVLSLFLHHLPDESIAPMLARAAQRTRQLLLVLDLERGWLPWWGIWVAARTVTRSPVVHVDSGLSVRAAFQPQELRAHALAAGLELAEVSRKAPFRLLMTWKPDRSTST